jgi:hypothetical protein
MSLGGDESELQVRAHDKVNFSLMAMQMIVFCRTSLQVYSLPQKPSYVAGVYHIYEAALGVTRGHLR